MGTLKPVDESATFGTARRGLGGLAPSPFIAVGYQMQQPTNQRQCTSFILFDVALNG